MAPGKSISLFDGTTFGWQGQGGYDGGPIYVDAPLRVAGNLTLTGWTVHGANYYLNNDLLNTNAATITVNAGIGMHFSKATNAYTGNWIMAAGAGPISAEANGALGTGLVDLPATNSVLSISGGLTLNNTFTGNGKFSAVTLQPTYRNSTLADAGVAPGTNATFVIGSLTNTGNLVFTNLPNYSGGNTAYCKVKIALAKNPTNGLGQASQLNVGGNLTGLANADLVVNAGPKLPVGTYTIITAANNLSIQQFHSVSFSGAFGRVAYNNGNVQVQILSAGTAVLFR